MASEPEEFDVIVIGGGPAGEHAAGRAERNGLSTAVVESELVGGECSYWACMPSKTLLRPGRVVAAARAVAGAREAVSGSIDAEAALGRRNWMTSDWHDTGQVDWLAEAGATLVRGRGRLVGERLVTVDGAEGERQLRARRAVIASTGSSAAIPPIEGLAETRYWTNREVTASQRVPPRLVVLGGGVVGAEMAQAWRRLGSAEVTIIEAGDRLVAGAEPFVGEILAKSFADEGIEVLTGAKATSVHHAEEDGPVEVRLEDGRRVHGDELLVAVGRRPRARDLGVEVIGLSPGDYLETDEQQRVRDVSGGWLYAIGDVTGAALLTHIGKYQARIAVDAILGSTVTAEAVLHHAVPSVIFTDPEIGAVGLTEVRAHEEGHEVVVVRVGTNAVAAASIHGDEVPGSCQLVVDRASEIVLGATFVGPDLAEALHAATVAVVGKVPMDRLRHAVPSFPTQSEVWLELVEEYGHSKR